MSGTDAETPKSRLQKAAYFLRSNMLLVFFLGIASGFPLLLTSSTLVAYLSEAGVNIKTIGIFALVGIPYSLKFLMAFFVDAVHFGPFKSKLAHRKSWCILAQLLLVVCILGMSYVDPVRHTLLLGVLATMTAAASALQDIVIDAMRIEMVKKNDQGIAAAAITTGYRIGMLMAGAGAFVLATYIPWNTVYLIGAGIMALGIPLTLSVRKLTGYDEFVAEKQKSEKPTQEQLENEEEGDPKTAQTTAEAAKTPDAAPARSFWKTALLDPLADFFRRPGALVILLFIALFKLGDAMAGSLSMPFYLEMGFTKIEIAGVTKVIGVIAVLTGTFAGGALVKALRIHTTLWICGILQLLSNFVFVWLANAGASVPVLTVCVCVENVTGGMGTAAFVAYISQLCNVRFTATQYALLSSISSLGRTFFSSAAGFIVAGVGWSLFYVSTAVLAIPGLCMLFWLGKIENRNAGRIDR